MFSQSKASQCRIICNLESGATNPYTIKDIMNNKSNTNINYEVRSNRFLHAKVFLGNKSVIVGSANASCNGLNFENRELLGWHEAGVVFFDEDQILKTQKWFDELWKDKETIKITDEAIKFAIKRWKNRRNNRQFFLRKNLLETLKNNPQTLKDRDIYIVMYEEEPSKEAELAYQELIVNPEYSNQHNQYGYYEGIRIPAPGRTIFIDVSYFNGKADYTGIWRGVKNHKTISIVHRDKLTVGDIQIEIGRQDKIAISKNGESLWGLAKKHNCVIPIYDVRDILLK